MRVLILNTVVLNTGDAAILVGLVNVLREAFGSTVQPVVFDAHVEAARLRYPEIRFQVPPYQVVTGSTRPAPRTLIRRVLTRLSRSLNVARFRTGLWLQRRNMPRLAGSMLTSDELAMISEFLHADLVVSTGGTYLVEHYALAPKFFDLDLAITLGRPLVLFTQSLGPFRDPGNRRAVRRVVAGSNLVLLRDERSRQHLLELGVEPDKLELCADAAFALPSREAVRGDAASAQPTLRVAISVRAWQWFASGTAGDGMARFSTSLAELTQRLVEERGASVTFISTCQGVPEYGVDDSMTAAGIIRSLPQHIQSRVSLDPDFHTPEAIETVLQQFDVVIATRMHFAILALLAGTIPIPVAYEFKTAELFAEIGMPHLVEDIETVSAASLLTKVDWALEHRHEVKAGLKEAVATQRARARSTATILRGRYRAAEGPLATTAT